jgi:hypothetical protein
MIIYIHICLYYIIRPRRRTWWAFTVANSPTLLALLPTYCVRPISSILVTVMLLLLLLIVLLLVCWGGCRSLSSLRMIRCSRWDGRNTSAHCRRLPRTGRYLEGGEHATDRTEVHLQTIRQVFRKLASPREGATTEGLVFLPFPCFVFSEFGSGGKPDQQNEIFCILVVVRYSNDDLLFPPTGR